MTRRLAPWIGLAAISLAGSIASAQQAPAGTVTGAAQQAPSDIDRARELARESADLLDQKKYADALDRATQAEALYHAAFHVSVIAESLEGLGRLAEAAAKYEALVAEPLSQSAPQVFKEAQERGKQRLSQLLARIPSLLVVVRGDTPGASATVDGNAFPLGSGAAVRFDAGPHRIRVTAPGFRPFEHEETLPPRGGVVTVTVTLEREGAQGAPTSTATAAPSGSPSVSPTAEGSRLPAAIAFGAGGAGLLVGAISGGLFLGRLDGLRVLCPDKQCTEENRSELDAVRTLGNVSTVGFAVGAVGVVAGAVLFFVRPGGGSVRTLRKDGVWVGPWIGGSSMGLGGRF
jgi:hypothetical protein